MRGEGSLPAQRPPAAELPLTPSFADMEQGRARASFRHMRADSGSLTFNTAHLGGKWKLQLGTQKTHNPWIQPGLTAAATLGPSLGSAVGPQEAPSALRDSVSPRKN